MRKETLKTISSLIENNVAAGFIRGQQIFAESLDEDLQKNEIIENVEVDGVMRYLLNDHYEKKSN